MHVRRYVRYHLSFSAAARMIAPLFSMNGSMDMTNTAADRTNTFPDESADACAAVDTIFIAFTSLEHQKWKTPHCTTLFPIRKEENQSASRFSGVLS